MIFYLSALSPSGFSQCFQRSSGVSVHCLIGGKGSERFFRLAEVFPFLHLATAFGSGHTALVFLQTAEQADAEHEQVRIRFLPAFIIHVAVATPLEETFEFTFEGDFPFLDRH